MNRILLIAMIGCMSNAHAEIFKCQDAGGKTSYQEVPCGDGAKTVKADVATRGRVRSNLPCDPENVSSAEKKLATYMILTAADSYSAIRSGGDINLEVSKFRKASAEAGRIPVPACLEPGRDVLQKYLDLTAERLAAASKGNSFESADTRSANLKAELLEAIEAARRQAREPKNVWATK